MSHHQICFYNIAKYSHNNTFRINRRCGDFYKFQNVFTIGTLFLFLLKIIKSVYISSNALINSMNLAWQIENLVPTELLKIHRIEMAKNISFLHSYFTFSIKINEHGVQRIAHI